jgi:hypothetical protein
MFKSGLAAWNSYVQRIEQSHVGPAYIFFPGMFSILIGSFAGMSFGGLSAISPAVDTFIMGGLIGIVGAVLLRLRHGLVFVLTHLPGVWTLAVISSPIPAIDRGTSIGLYAALGIGQVVAILFFVGAVIGVWTGELLVVTLAKLKRYWLHANGTSHPT